MVECIAYFVNEFVSGYRFEDLTELYCCNKCSESRLCSVKAFENCLRHECEESVSGMVGLKPCWTGESWMCGVMFCRINFSSILDGMERNNASLLEVDSVGGLLDFRMGTTLASFLDVGILQCVTEKLYMSVTALMACVPKCFRCKVKMPSGPKDDVFFVLPMALLTICVVNGSIMFVIWGMACRRLRISVLSSVFSQHMDAKCLFSLSACVLYPNILYCVKAFCVSSIAVYLLLRPLTSF